MPAEARILAAVLNELQKVAAKNVAHECCGLLAGRDGTITKALSAPNAAANPATSYEIAPEDVFRLIREIRESGLQMMGIYHSHPRGKNEPSARDIELAYYPGAAYFIIAPAGVSPEKGSGEEASTHVHRQKPVRAFTIREGISVEMDIRAV
jgi:proteasome lid subunit RPN8/RPN11